MFRTTFWITFGAVFGAILELFLGSKWSQKVDLFLKRLLLALWKHFGRFLGCLGALLGGQMVQIYCKNHTKQQFSKSLLFWGSLPLLEALVGAKWAGKVVGFDCIILSQIGPSWGHLGAKSFLPSTSTAVVSSAG